MTNRFFTNFKSPDGSDLKLYLDEPVEGTRSVNPPGFLKKIPNEGDSADWTYVETHLSQTMAMPIDRGWIKTWGLGKPLPDIPQVIRAQALTFSAVANELDDHYESENRIASEFLLALFIIENQIDSETEMELELELAVNDTSLNPDFRGGFAITTEQWDAFIAAEGQRLNWSGDFLRELILPQMRCANWLAHRNRKHLGVAFGAKPTEPFVPRMLDLFLAHLIGHVAAAAVIKMERNEDGMQKKIRTIVRDSNSWSDSSPELVKLFENRAAYMGELNAAGGGLTSVTSFLEACQAALDPALTLARKMLDAYLPGFAVTPMGSGAWMEAAETELQKWSDGWTEQVDPGRSTATGYFAATDYGPAIVIDANNELTHWCGAFVAHCMKTARLSVPAESAAAANWRNWGDKSLPATPGSDIPVGAVVMTSGGEGSNHIGHVTLFTGWKNDGQSFLGLGGNQTDSVTIAPFKTDRIVDIRVLTDKSVASGQDLEILAKTLWGEIRGGDDVQVINVANVLLNRFLSGYRSDGSIAGTCLKHKQFSCWNPGTKSLKDIQALASADPELLRLTALADQVMSVRLAHPDAPAPLEGARHYHNHNVNPNWAIPSKVVIDDGKHIFYKDIA